MQSCAKKGETWDFSDMSLEGIINTNSWRHLWFSISCPCLTQFKHCACLWEKWQINYPWNSNVSTICSSGSFSDCFADSSGGLSPFHEPLAAKTGCVTSSSLEYLEVQQPPPRTPRLLKRQESPQQEPSRIGGRTKDSPLILNIVHSFESVDREDQIDQVSPTHQYRILGSPMNFPYKSSSERTLSPLFQPGSASPVHPTQVSFTYEEKVYPAKEEAVSPTQLVSNNPLGSPNCVKSRGRFPMMGIGQMLRKRNQTMQSASDKPLEARMPQLQQMSPTQISFNAADAVSGQC